MSLHISNERLCIKLALKCPFLMYEWDVTKEKTVACCNMQVVIRGTKTPAEACIEKKIEADVKIGE